MRRARPLHPPNAHAPVAQNISPRARHWCTLPAFPGVAFPSPAAIRRAHPRRRLEDRTVERLTPARNDARRYDTRNHSIDAPGDPSKRAFTYFILTGGRVIDASALRLAVLKFLLSMSASADVVGAPSLEVDLGKIEKGQTARARARGKPVFIRRRTERGDRKSAAVDVGAALSARRRMPSASTNPEWLAPSARARAWGASPSPTPETSTGGSARAREPLRREREDQEGARAVQPRSAGVQVPRRRPPCSSDEDPGFPLETCPRRFSSHHWIIPGGEETREARIKEGRSIARSFRCTLSARASNARAAPRPAAALKPVRRSSDPAPPPSLSTTKRARYVIRRERTPSPTASRPPSPRALRARVPRVEAAPGAEAVVAVRVAARLRGVRRRRRLRARAPRTAPPPARARAFAPRDHPKRSRLCRRARRRARAESEPAAPKSSPNALLSLGAETSGRTNSASSEARSRRAGALRYSYETILCALGSS